MRLSLWSKKPEAAPVVTFGETAARLDGVAYNDAPDLRDFVFVAGLHRSGTTLLERLLTSRYALSYLRADVPESEGQHMQTVFPPALSYGGPGRFAFSQAMRDEFAALSDPDACRAAILAQWGRFVVGEAPVLLEKSPPNLTRIDWLRRVFPGSRFVIMTRDPRAVAAATQKWSGTSLPELMMHWNAAYSQAMEAYSERDCVLLRYEDLVADPEAELARLAGALGLQPGAGAALEERFGEVKSSNDKYIAAHEGAVYGAGIWDRFGYAV